MLIKEKIKQGYVTPQGFVAGRCVGIEPIKLHGKPLCTLVRRDPGAAVSITSGPLPASAVCCHNLHLSIQLIQLTIRHHDKGEYPSRPSVATLSRFAGGELVPNGGRPPELAKSPPSCLAITRQSRPKLSF